MAKLAKTVVAVTGCTGTGKTKLGIELARQFNGEVISADSMQLYRGLDVITNTVTEEEAQGIPHHCVSYVEPSECYTVTKYVEHTIPMIEDIIRRGKLPIIVGGTAYYIEALLWNFTLPQTSENKSDLSEEIHSVLESTTLTSYEKLQKVDPVSASRLHPNNTRKVERSLEVFEQHGVRLSDVLTEQHKDNDDLRGALRWDSAIIFSLSCQQEVLDKRLDDRVDQMLDNGLVDELKVFETSYKETISAPSDIKSGLLSQAIGYKEFDQYLLHVARGGEEGEEKERCLNVGIEAMKQRTRRYSRKQLKWIEHRLLINTDCTVHTLDCTDLTLWREQVLGTSIEIMSQFLSGSLSIHPTITKPVKSKEISFCVQCEVHCEGLEQYNVHLASRKHRKRVAGIARREGNKRRKDESEQCDDVP